MSQTKNPKADVICPACDIGPFTRNHYFTGKLLVERDFTDEQRYYIQKLRHHNKRLHGWGVVCGLKVKQHESQLCQSRFVCVEPGTAIDCCGREIILREETCFDIFENEKIKELEKKQDFAAHTLQIRICYRECPTEEIPVLYDECGCDDTRCAPNRILESYTLEVAVDPPQEPENVFTPKFESEFPITVAHSFRVALHEATNRLYVMTTNGPGTIVPVSTANHAFLPSRALPTKGLAMAVSNDGTRLYVVTEATTNPATTKRQLLVFDTADLSAPGALIRTLDLDDSVDSDIALAVAPEPDGRLFVLIAKPGIVRMFSAGINTAAGTPSPTNTPALGANLSSLVIGTDGSFAYVADATNKVLVIKVAGATLDSTINVLPANSVISVLAVVHGAGDMLAVADRFNKQLHLVGLTPQKLIGSSSALAQEPIALAVSSGGQWVYVLEKDLTKDYVQAVSANAIQLAPAGQQVKPEPEFEVPAGSQQLLLTESGEHLYIPFTGDLTVATDGGVAILEIDEKRCSEILWRHLEGCPHCDKPNCIVLATIENYNIGERLMDPVDPPSDPLVNDAANIARINNRKGRKLLPSTEVLTELMECLLEHPAGGAGEQGPVGPQGPAGISVQTADAVSVLATQPASATFNPATGNIHFEIPKGEKGIDGTGTGGLDNVTLQIVDCGTPGSAKIVQVGGQQILELVIPSACDLDLTHICAINWPHGQIATPTVSNRIQQTGLMIAFDRNVFNADINRQTFILLRPEQNQDTGLTCWCEVLPKRVGGVKFPSPCKIGEPEEINDPAAMVNGAQFIPANRFIPDTEYRVVLKGNFIRDEKGRAVDADHIPDWLNTDRSGDGVEGGTFESWFTFRGRQ